MDNKLSGKVPPLPFKQYTRAYGGCCLVFGNKTKTNRFQKVS